MRDRLLLLLLCATGANATPGYPVETSHSRTCICCTGVDNCCHFPFSEWDCNWRKTDKKCSKGAHCKSISRPPHGDNPNGEYNVCRCDATDRPWARGRRMSVISEVVEEPPE